MTEPIFEEQLLGLPSRAKVVVGAVLAVAAAIACVWLWQFGYLAGVTVLPFVMGVLLVGTGRSELARGRAIDAEVARAHAEWGELRDGIAAAERDGQSATRFLQQRGFEEYGVRRWILEELAGARGDARRPIFTGSQDGILDLSFSLESREAMPDGGERLVAKGLDGTREVGFAVVLRPGWVESVLEEIDLTTYRSDVVVESCGVESDAFVQAVDRLYGSHLGARWMKRETRFVAISLGGHPAQLDAGPVRIKLFHDDEDEDRYAEVYLNIDVARGRVDWDEKDEDFRAPLVRVLTSP